MNQAQREIPIAVIFGGAGFIGRTISRHLLESGIAGEVLLADIARPSEPLIAGERFFECDVRRPIGLPVEDVELVVNLAAVHRTPGHEDFEYHETNESGARNVTEFATSTRCGRIWFTSSIAVYGPGEQAVTESSEPKPVSAYGKSKLAAEQIHRAWALEAAERKLLIARPATVFGPGENGNFTRLAAAMKRRLFFYPGRRDTRKACGYVRDLPRAFAFMESRADQVALFNFAYPAPPTIEQVCAAFALAGGLPEPRVTIPGPLLLGAGAALKRVGLKSFDPERVKKLMASTNVIGAELERAGFEFEYDLEAGLADWYSSPPAGTFN